LRYGLVVRLALFSTPPHGDAVTVGYKPESVYLRRTFTSLTWHTHRHTGPDNLLSGWRSHTRPGDGSETPLAPRRARRLASLRDPDNKLSGPPEFLPCNLLGVV